MKKIHDLIKENIGQV